MVTGGVTTTTTALARELAFRGFDGEVGIKLPQANHAPGETRFYAGGFLFQHEDFDAVLLGPKLRLEWRMDDFLPAWPGSRLTVDATYRWDEVRDHAVEAGFRLRLPFEKGLIAQPRLTPQEARMTERVERDTDVITRAKVTTSVSKTGAPEVKEKVEDAITGVDFDRAVVVANGTSLQAAADAAGANNLLIAQGGAFNFGQTFLKADQTLLGGGGDLLVRGLSSGQTATFTAPGLKPTIEFTSVGVIVATVGGNHITGVDLKGGANPSFYVSNSAVLLAGANNALTRTRIYDIDSSAVIISGASGAFLDDVDITSAGVVAGTAFLSIHNSKDVIANNVRVHYGMQAAVYASDSNVVVTNLEIDGSYNYLFFFGGPTNVNGTDIRASLSTTYTSLCANTIFNSGIVSFAQPVATCP